MKCPQCNHEGNRDLREYQLWFYCPTCGYEIPMKLYSDKIKPSEEELNNN